MLLNNLIRSCLKNLEHHRRAVCAGAVILLTLMTVAALVRPKEVAAQTQVAVVSAASYERDVAPGSIAAAFGTNLATSTIAAINLPLPTTLGGTTVEINGVRAALFFVSPFQVNFEIPSSATSGTATIVVRAGNGTVSNGTVQIKTVAPGIFSANSNGQGVPAAVAVRLKSDGSQTFEPISRTDASTNKIIPKPIDLGPSNERVFLILFATGIRLASIPTVRVIIGGREVTLFFVGPTGAFVGLDQINLELPRSLIGAGRVNLSVSVSGAAASSLGEIEIAGATGPGTGPVTITGFSPTLALAGQFLSILGTGFAASASQNEVRIGNFSASVIAASTTQLTIIVPFGVETAPVTVTTANGQGTSVTPLAVRTSISGMIADTNRSPLANVTIRVIGTGISALTDARGIFVLPDVPTGNVDLEIDVTTVPGSLPYPKLRLKFRVTAGRDNTSLSLIELQQVTGPVVTLPSTFQVGNVVLTVPSGAAIRASDGSILNTLSLVLADPNRPPAPFPQAHFSSTVVQILPEGATITPGGRFTLPNGDRYPAGAAVSLFRLDQTTGSPTFNTFVQVGQATVSTDGLQIETAANAITGASYYFVSQARQETTVTGRVLEADGTPARQATVVVRGRSEMTDGSGSYVLRRVPVSAGDRVTVEASILRQTGMDRATSADVAAEINGVTTASDIRFPPIGGNRPPLINAPTSLSVNAGETLTTSLIVTDPDQGQTVQVTLSQVSFAAVSDKGQGVYELRLAPNAAQVGKQTLRVTATDNLGASTSVAIEINVLSTAANRAPIANAANVATNEDSPLAITLSGSDPDNDTLRFIVTSDPQRGRLSGTAPNLTYTPNQDFNGSDSFQFRVNDGRQDSATATISINVAQVNDAPALIVPDSQTTSAGQLLSFTISATDVDAGQTLNFTAPNLPGGATITPSGATSAQFAWTPAVAQAGSYEVTFTVRDNGSPVLSASKTVNIKVGAPLAMDQRVTLNEDAITPILLTGEDRGGLQLSYIVVTQPQHGALSGAPPNLIYIPQPNYNGGDSFRFKVNNGRADSADALVGLTINPVNDPPTLNVPGTQRVRAGESLSFTVAVQDPDGDQTPTFSTSGLLPENAIFDQNSQTDVNSRQFYWTPSVTQVGSYKVSFVVTDDGEPRAADVKDVTITVDAGTPSGADWIRTLATGQFITALASEGTTIYAGTPGGGVFRSTNQGQSFSPVPSTSGGLPAGINATAIAINGQNIFVGTQTFNEGIFRSTNGGQTWQSSNSGLANKNINVIAILNGAIYAGTDGGLFRSTNNGGNWSSVNDGLGVFPVYALLANGQTLLAGTLGGGLFSSANNAQNWTPVQLGPKSSKVLALALLNGALLAGTEGGGIFRSTDNGATWRPAANGLPANLLVYALTISGGNLYAGTIHGVFVSPDGGVSWRQINNGLLESRITSLAVTNIAILAGTRFGGVFRRTF